MPGAYAHITLVNLAKEPARLEKVPGFPEPAIAAVMKNFRFTELGAVSPDYPYLAVGDAKAAAWADLLHHVKIGDVIKSGIEAVARRKGEEQQKAFAWLSGFVAHVVTDVTIHPVVQLKVGPYVGNEKAHRICEMNQDAYIFQRMNLGEIGLSEHLTSGIWGCCDKPGSGKLDPVIEKLWQEMFAKNYPVEHQANPPDIHKWHKSFNTWVNKIGEEGNKLMPLARHVGVGLGLTYPEAKNTDLQFLQSLKTPIGPMHYDQVFDKALANVVEAWRFVGGAIYANETQYQTFFGNWDLDSGENEVKKPVYWS